MYAPPITGLGMVAIRAESLPSMLMAMRIMAPARTTQREATPVRPISPMFSVYDVVPTAPKSPAKAQFAPSAPIPRLMVFSSGSERPET